MATASVLALAAGSVGAAQAADLSGAAPIIPQEFSEPGRTISGTVSLGGSYSWLEAGSDDDQDVQENPWSIVGDARVDIPFSDQVSLQFDQYGEALFASSQNTSEDLTGGYLTGAHLTYREMDRYLFGVFGGVGKVHFASTTDDAYTQWLAGVEGQAYFGNTTLYGQGGYADNESNQSSSANLINEAWFLRGVVRQYLNAGDTKLEGEIGWATGVNDNGVPGSITDDIDAVWWGAEIEHAVWSFGDDGFVSLFARYDGYYYDESGQFGDTDQSTNHVVTLGITMDMNTANPLARERYGAAVDLPNMNRINGHSRLVD